MLASNFTFNELNSNLRYMATHCYISWIICCYVFMLQCISGFFIDFLNMCAGHSKYCILKKLVPRKTSWLYFWFSSPLNIAISFSPKNSMCTNNCDASFTHKLWCLLLSLVWRRYELHGLLKFAPCHSSASCRLKFGKSLTVSTEKLNDLFAQPSYFTHFIHSTNIIDIF